MYVAAPEERRTGQSATPANHRLSLVSTPFFHALLHLRVITLGLSALPLSLTLRHVSPSQMLFPLTPISSDDV